MAAGLDFQFSFRPAPQQRRGASEVFHLLILGDLSGRTPRAKAIAGRAPVRVDVDNFEAVFQRFAPRLSLALPSGEELPLSFASLDDFHPDALYRRLPLFQNLRELRRRLLEPSSFAAAAAELQSGAAALAPETDSATLDRLLGAAPGASAPRATAAAGAAGIVDSLLRQAVGTQAVAAPSPQRDVYLQTLDAQVAGQMRAILHHPDFQALEAAWLGVRRLVEELGGNDDIHLELLDVSREELVSDLAAAGGDAHKTGLWTQLVEGGPGAPGGKEWSALASPLIFGPGPADLSLLAHLGAVASGCGAPFLAGGAASLLGLGSLAAQPDPRQWPSLAPDATARWQLLRQSALAPWIGLAMPRVLLRLPYGKRGEPVESFPFDEFAGGFEHEACLWGGPGLALGLLLGLGFAETGESMAPGDVTELEDLPAYIHEVEGEKCLLPCAEVLLGERAAEALLSRGLMPIMSHKDRNAARLIRFQSIAGTALSGPWGEGD